MGLLMPFWEEPGLCIPSLDGFQSEPVVGPVSPKLMCWGTPQKWTFDCPSNTCLLSSVGHSVV